MRVVAGRLRGRALHAPRGSSTRPTADRARQVLFDWLGPLPSGAQVLDLFAGSGSLGIEALSRGASHATFVERERGALTALRRNVEALDLIDCARLLPYDVQRAIGGLLDSAARFDLILADPPYTESANTEAWKETQPLEKLLNPGARFVLERSKRAPEQTTLGGLVLRASRACGETRFDCYERTEDPES